MARLYVPDAAPFLKWAGGKSQLLRQYRPYFPAREQIRRYYEPFIGSAAVYFDLQPPNACLADVNAQLIELYQVVQHDVDALIPLLRTHRNERDHYYRTRALQPADLSPVERAARLIYLNKTCYNGLYRENRQGHFNVPFGRYKNPTICDEVRLRSASRALQAVELLVADFESVVSDAGPGDLVYFDPPYVPVSATSSFTSYNRHGFGAEDQRRLARTFHRLAARGVCVLLSNSSAPFVYDLYDGHGYLVVEVQSRRSINSRADGRGPVVEAFIVGPGC
jgi:DNA adenine methylase